MNGVKRGLFSNEAGSGSAPCAAAAAQSKDPVRTGLTQSLGVLIDTIVICSCTAMIMLLVPEELTSGLTGMDLLQTAMQYHLGLCRCHFYCSDPGFVQLLHLHRHSLLRPVQYRLPLRRQLALSNRI